jgi:hypothetical protein
MAKPVDIEKILRVAESATKSRGSTNGGKSTNISTSHYSHEVFMRLFSCLMLGLGLSVSPMVQAAVKKLASVEVTIEGKEPIDAAKGIRTLYVIVYDAKSPMPRPYGAMKVDLKADASGTLYKGDLTFDPKATSTKNEGNVQVMGAPTPPTELRLKARLDKDGSAGGDQPGDIVGKAEKVAAGSTTKIVINTVIK